MTTDPAYQATQVPVVVLVDNNTASSAEIMSGALQSAGRAQIVGEQTFGTGTVLLPYTLSDGSVIRLAIERWLTPDGNLIFGKGITPDHVVALGPDDVPIEPNDLSNISADQLRRSRTSSCSRRSRSWADRPTHPRRAARRSGRLAASCKSAGAPSVGFAPAHLRPWRQEVSCDERRTTDDD